MIFIFLSHLRKSFLRSPSVGKDTGILFFLGLITLMMAVYALAAGFALERIIVGMLKQQDAITFLNGVLAYYFVSEFATRYFLQRLPALDVRPYLHLPVPRSKIVHFLLCRSLLHPLNVFVFLLFAPFAFTVVAREHSVLHAWIWLLSLWLISLVNHFLTILVKKQVARKAWGFPAFVVVCILLGYADYFGWLQLSFVSQQVFAVILNGYAVAVLLLTAVVFLYYMTYRAYADRLYPEEVSVRESQSFNPANLGFLQGMGLTGAWIRLELKLIFRNRRSREVFLMHAVFLLFPLGFYAYSNNRDSYGSLLFFAIISSGFFLMNYGQFLFSWQGAHFDFTLVQPSSLRKFITAKYWLLVAPTAVWFLLSIPYALLGWHFLLINFVASLFNIGVNIYVVMILSMWEAKAIDLRRSGSLNMEGIGPAQWVMGIPLFVTPYLFYGPLSLLGYPIAGLVAVGIAGLVGLLFRQKVIDTATGRLAATRYTMASSFRKSS